MFCQSVKLKAIIWIWNADPIACTLPQIHSETALLNVHVPADTAKLTSVYCCPISHKLDPRMDTLLCMKQRSTH